MVKTCKYVDTLKDANRQSLIDMYYQNNDANIPLGFINLAKVGFRGLFERHRNSASSVNVEQIYTELDNLKTKVEEFIQSNGFTASQADICHQELRNLNKEIARFIKAPKKSRKKSTGSKGKASTPSKKGKKEAMSEEEKKTTFRVAAVLVTVLMAYVFYQPISNIIWQTFVSSDISNISSTISITSHSTEGRRLDIFIDPDQIKDSSYTELKTEFSGIMEKAFDMGFHSIMIKSNTDEILAKNIVINGKQDIYIFYTSGGDSTSPSSSPGQ